MFTKIRLLGNVKMIATSTILLLGCIALQGCQKSANGQENSEIQIELLKVLELQLNVAASLGRSDLTTSLEKTIENVKLASPDELDAVENSIGEIQNYGNALQKLDSSIHRAIEKRSLETPPFTASTTDTTDGPPVSLTPPAYFDGGILGILCKLPDASIGVRNDTEVVLDAKIAVGVAKTVWAGVEVACGLDVVALGTGGVGFVACAAYAVILAAAEETLDAFLRCDATVDEAHLDAAFKRAEDNFNLGTHIYNKLDTHDADIKALLSEIAENQREIIKLLKTPQGNRPGWNTEGY